MSYPFKLLSCPFCGGSADIYNPWPHADSPDYYVTHYSDYNDCPAETRRLEYSMRHKSPMAAANSWNARLSGE